MDYTDFQLAMEGWQQMREAEEQQHWERSRWMAAAILSPHSKPGRSIKPTDLIKFPWDSVPRKKNTKAMNDQAFRELMAIAKPQKT